MGKETAACAPRARLLCELCGYEGWYPQQMAERKRSRRCLANQLSAAANAQEGPPGRKRRRAAKTRDRAPRNRLRTVRRALDREGKSFVKYLRRNIKRSRAAQRAFAAAGKTRGRTHFVPFGRKRGLLAADVHDITEALEREFCDGGYSITYPTPELRVLPTTLCAGIGFTPAWVEMLGRVPAAWDPAYGKRIRAKLLDRWRSGTAGNLLNASVKAIRCHSFHDADSAKTAKRRIRITVAIVEAVARTAGPTRKLWLDLAEAGDPHIKDKVLTVASTTGFPAFGYLQGLSWHCLEAVNAAWELPQRRSLQYTGRDGAAKGIAHLAGGTVAELKRNALLFSLRLEEVRKELKTALADAGDDADWEFDGKDIVPQLCEWQRCGCLEVVQDAPHLTFGGATPANSKAEVRRTCGAT